MGIRGSRYINTYASSSAAKLRKSEGDRETERQREIETERYREREKRKKREKEVGSMRAKERLGNLL